ncbi:MAG: MBL fold metallo-hydrolase [Planctomycetota bacterium]|nr:MBL fold metallo-hydrolase [Planctomycetota bacterium]
MTELTPACPEFELIFLGCGTSTGVPMIGCDCVVCQSEDPRNQRTRPSVLLRTPRGNILIDTSPEMRLQLLREKAGPVHAILYTHGHADHLFGLDDSRLFARALGGKPVPVYCETEVEALIRTVFSYAFVEETKRFPSGGVPRLTLTNIEPFKPFDVIGYEVIPMRLDHGKFKVLGFRFGDLAYCTDVSRIPDESFALLQGLEVLVLDALRFEKHPTHFSLAEALAVIEKLQPRQAFLTHMSHSFDYHAVSANLPPNVQMAYDGLRVGWSGIQPHLIVSLDNPVSDVVNL